MKVVIDSCRCGRPRQVGRLRCARCCAMDTERHRSKQREWSVAGLCTACGRETVGTAKRCPRCQARACRNAKRHIVDYFDRVLNHYGSRCNCCGETERGFLTIDHVRNDGAAHRRQLLPSHRVGLGWYRWIVRHKYPDFLQILCWNCNMSKARLGACPHNLAWDALLSA